MFRKMRRFKQELTKKECVELLKESKRGVLSVIVEDGYPRGIPVDHWYDEEDGCIYFHGAKEGQKIDALKDNNKVSYCVMVEDGKEENSWILHFRSVNVYGRMELVEDEDTKIRACSGITRKFTDDEEYLQYELDKSLPRVQVLKLVPEHISGKKIKES